MPDTLTDARTLAGGKTSIPAELRTAEWAMMPQWLRERAFYMAGVAHAETLDEFRAEAEKIANGESSIPEAEKRLGIFLDKSGYQPLPGQEGTIKDLRSWRRMRVALRTNVELLQGWGQKNRGMTRGAVMASPAWELVRVSPRQVPRDWLARFTLSGGIVRGGRMFALKTSKVWAELGNFPDGLGVDYPPFAWGSGMGWRAVGFREAVKLGLIPDGWKPPPREPLASPNENLQTTPRISDRPLRAELARRMQGLAEWQGDKLVFTDPNGTRPATPEALAKLWKTELPETFADLPGNGQTQRESFLQWVAEHGFYWNEGSETTRLGRTNVWEDFQRVLKRLVPNGREKQELFRALTWNSNEKFSEFMAGVRRDGYAARPETPAESWTASMQSARKYLGTERYTVLLRLPDGHGAGRDIAPLVRAFQSELRRREVPEGKLAVTDDEIVLPSWAGLRVKTIGKPQDTRTGKSVEIILEEVKP